MKKISNVIIFIVICLVSPGANCATAQDLVEKLTFLSSDKPASAQATLLFEEKTTNDEGIEILAPPKVEKREAKVTSVEDGKWEVAVQLRPGDRERRPILTCVLTLVNGRSTVVPNRTLSQDVIGTDGIQLGVASCQKGSGVLTTTSVRSLTPEARADFVRTGDEESKKLSEEIGKLLDDETKQKLFDYEVKFGLAPSKPISSDLSVFEFTKRLVALESVWR